jgi:hypothetical protein
VTTLIHQHHFGLRQYALRHAGRLLADDVLAALYDEHWLAKTAQGSFAIIPNFFQIIKNQLIDCRNYLRESYGQLRHKFFVIYISGGESSGPFQTRVLAGIALLDFLRPHLKISQFFFAELAVDALADVLPKTEINAAGSGIYQCFHAFGVQSGIIRGQQAAKRVADDDPGLDAQMAAQRFHVGSHSGHGDVLGVDGRHPRLAGSALIKEDGPVLFGELLGQRFKPVAVHARPAVDDEHGAACAVGFVVNLHLAGGRKAALCLAGQCKCRAQKE